MLYVHEFSFKYLAQFHTLNKSKNPSYKHSIAKDNSNSNEGELYKEVLEGFFF